MREIYEFSVIRYFPTSLSEEFINIGVFLHGHNGVEKILTEENARELHCSALIGDRKKFLGLVEYLNELSINGTLQDKNHYFNNFRFTDARQIASSKDVKEIIEDLYYDFVGHKFVYESKIPARATIIKNSLEIAKEHFQGYINIQRTTLFDFEIESVKKKIIHYSSVGSTTNKQDVANMIMLPQQQSENREYDFLDISKRHTAQQEHFLSKLQINNIKACPFSNRDEIAKYFEMIA